MIVVDTNVIAYYWLNGEYTQNTYNLLRKDSDWVVPFLWRSEFRNVLAMYQRKELISLDMALQIIEKSEKQFKGREYFVNSAEVLKLTSKSDCSAYDCEFIALASDLNIKLVTSDKKLLKNFPTIAISLFSF